MIYIILTLTILLIELILKDRMEQTFDLKKEQLLPGGKILLRKYHNYGAFLNFMQKKKKMLHLISIIFTLVILILFLLTLGKYGNKILKTGLSLLLGGAFSNTYDRLTKGYVVDYFSFVTPFKKLNQIVFNLSDFCILIGCLLIVLQE